MTKCDACGKETIYREGSIPDRLKKSGFSYNYYLASAEAIVDELENRTNPSNATIYEHTRKLTEMMYLANIGTKDEKYWKFVLDSIHRPTDTTIKDKLKAKDVNYGYYVSHAKALLDEMKKENPWPYTVQEHLSSMAEMLDIVEGASGGDPKSTRFWLRMSHPEETKDTYGLRPNYGIGE